MEHIAEDLISHKLQQAGFLVAKPKFDRNGADLLVFMNVNEETKFCRIQCKGRSLLNSNSSNIEVLKSYITESFVLFLYVDDGNDNTTSLFCFFASDIERNWNFKSYKDSSKDLYRLSFSKTTFRNSNKLNSLIKYSLTENKIDLIKRLIKNANSKKELDKMQNIIKKQNDLIKLQQKQSDLEKQTNSLEKLLNEIEHINEVKGILEDKIALMEAHYKLMKAQNNDESKNAINY